MLSPETLAARKGRITSSTAAACLGLDPYTSPIQAWTRIRGQENTEDNPAMARGRALEDPILNWCASEVGGVLERVPFVIHHDHDFLGDSADGLLRSDQSTYALEAKTVAMGRADRWGEPGTDQVPDKVLIQCMMHLIHWPEASRCAVPILIGGYEFEFRLYWVNRDLSLEKTLIDRLHSWHAKHIIGGEQPEPTAKDERWLQDRYPVATKPALDDPALLPDVEKWAREYKETAALLKAAETQKKLAAVHLRRLLEEHSEARGDGWSVTYRNSKDRTRTNWQAVAEAMGPPDDLIQKHTTVAPGARSLRVTVR